MLNSAGTTETVLVSAAVLCGVVGFFLVPWVFGPLTIMFGAIEATVYNRRAGMVLVILGVGSTIIGSIISVLTWMALY